MARWRQLKMILWCAGVLAGGTALALMFTASSPAAAADTCGGPSDADSQAVLADNPLAFLPAR